MKKSAALFITISISILSVFGMSAVLPVFPMIALEFNVPSESMWMLMSAFTVPGIVFAPLGGILSDRIGRKAILVFALILVIIGCFMSLFAETYTSLVISRVVQGIGTGTMATLSGILVGDLFLPDERAKIMGLSMTCVTISAAVAPVFGGFFGAISWRIPFVLSFFAIPVLYFAFRIKFPEVVKSANVSESYFKSALKALNNSTLIAWFIFSAIVGIIVFGPQITYLPIFADHFFKTSASTIGMIFGIASIATAITSFSISKLLKKYSVKAILIVAITILTLSNFVFFVVPSEWWLCAAGIIFGLAHGLIYPILGASVIGFTTNETRGAIMSINGTITRIGQAAAPFTASLCWVAFGPYGPYVLAIILGCILYLFLPILCKRNTIHS